MAKYFTVYEFIKSDTAKKLNIDNTPNEEQMDNILELMRVMDKIRERWTDYCEQNYLQSPEIIVNSGYRCNDLNEAVGGSETSAHRIGSACDFEAKNGHNSDLFKVVQQTLYDEGIMWDQLIDENDGAWIHLGLKNRNGIRRMQIKSLWSEEK